MVQGTYVPQKAPQPTKTPFNAKAGPAMFLINTSVSLGLKAPHCIFQARIYKNMRQVDLTHTQGGLKAE